MTIAQKKIINYMASNSLSQDQTAKKLGISKASMSRILHGRMIFNTRERLEKIEQILCINNDWTTNTDGTRIYSVDYPNNWDEDSTAITKE